MDIAIKTVRYISLFAGIDAATVAWRPIGWECAAVAEIEPFCCELLAHYYIDTPNLGDVTAITEAQIKALGRVDLVVFGSPCQDLSVAGKRAGMEGARSGLFFDAMRIVRWSNARYALWENVPGAFSSNGGKDFALVVGEMAGLCPDIPDGGWKNTGVVLGPDALVEYCVLDAQWFGVPQRRRRIFALRDIGDWANRPPVLFNAESLCGDRPPSRKAGQGITGTINARTQGGGGLGTDFDLSGGVIPILEPTGRQGKGDIAHCLNAGGMDRIDYATETMIVGTLPSGGTPNGHGTAGVNDQAVFAGHVIPVAFSCKDSGADAGELSPTLRAMGHSASHPNAGGQVAVAVSLRGRDGGATAELGDECGNALRASGEAHVLAPWLPQGYRPQNPELAADTVTNNPAGGTRINPVLSGMAVRRLTPRECERLQGFPDDYTLIHRNGKLAADGPRYRALGNSMAVPVMAWIGRRIQEAIA